MKRLGLVAVICSLALAGCSGDQDPAPTSAPTSAAGSATPVPTTTTGPDASPSASAQAPIVFTVDGGGPYQLGATLSALKTAGQLESVATNAEVCPTNTTAQGTGVWKDLRLSFRADGRLYLVVNRSAKIPTPSGAWLGMTLAALQSIYGPIGKELSSGGAVAYLVTTDTGGGILFDLDDKKKVMSMIAGEAGYLKSSYLGGTDFC